MKASALKKFITDAFLFNVKKKKKKKKKKDSHYEERKANF